MGSEIKIMDLGWQMSKNGVFIVGSGGMNIGGNSQILLNTDGTFKRYIFIATGFNNLTLQNTGNYYEM